VIQFLVMVLVLVEGVLLGWSFGRARGRAFAAHADDVYGRALTVLDEAQERHDRAEKLNDESLKALTGAKALVAERFGDLLDGPK
jgi:predicted negative regulator of RcsB-dependent stress response